MSQRIVEYVKGSDIKNKLSEQEFINIMKLRKAVVWVYSIFIVFFLFLLYLGYLTFVDTGVPVSYANEPFPVLTEVVQPGDLLIYEVEFCRYDESPIDFTLGWRNVETNGWEAGQSWNDVLGEEGCHTIYPQFRVPELTEGNYVLELSVTLETNWLHKETIIIRTQQFFVEG